MSEGDPKTDADMKTAIDDLLREVRHDRDKWDGAVATLRRYLEGELKSAARDLLKAAAKRERLELQWTLDELLEETAPPPPPSAKKPEPPAREPEPEPELPTNPPRGQLRPEDLVPIYDDPRGLMIHRHKVDGRWFLTQINPQTGQPQTMELAEHHKSQIQAELAGSPHWLEKTWGGNGGGGGLITP